MKKYIIILIVVIGIILMPRLSLADTEINYGTSYTVTATSSSVFSPNYYSDITVTYTAPNDTAWFMFDSGTGSQLGNFGLNSAYSNGTGTLKNVLAGGNSGALSNIGGSGYASIGSYSNSVLIITMPNGSGYFGSCPSDNYTGCLAQVQSLSPSNYQVTEFYPTSITPSPSLVMINPTSSVPLYTPFDNFVVEVANTEPLADYVVHGVYQYYGDNGSNNLLCQNVSVSQTLFGDGNSHNLLLPRPVCYYTGNANVTTTYVQATFNLFNLVNASGSVTSTSVFFHMSLSSATTSYNYVSLNASGTLSISLGSTTVYQSNGSSSTGLFVCNSPSNILDIGGGIIWGGCVLFNPQQAYTNYISQSLLGFTTVFPFSAVYGIVNGVQIAVTSTAGGLPVQILGIHGTYITLATVTSSTLVNAFTTASNTNDFGYILACDNSCANDKVSNLFNVEIMLIWLTAGLLIVTLIVKFN